MIDTNTSSRGYSVDEYGEVIIFDTEAQNTKGEQSEHSEEVTDDAKWVEIIYNNE